MTLTSDTFGSVIVVHSPADLTADQAPGFTAQLGHAEPALVVRLDASLPAEALLAQAALVGHWAGNQHLLVETAGHELRVRIAAAPALMLEAAHGLDLPGAQTSIETVAFACDIAPVVAGHPHE